MLFRLEVPIIIGVTPFMILNIPSLRGLSCSELLEKSYHHSFPCRYGSPGEVLIPHKGSSHKRVTKLFATESLDSSSYPKLLLKKHQKSQCVISGIKPEKVRDLVFRGIWDMFHPFWIRSHVFRIQHKQDFQGLWNQQEFLNKRIDFVKFILVFSIFRLIDFIFPLSLSIPNSSSSS